ncbi:MAG TPA: hypothetical protein VNH18_14050 [Bryobacteraceae bacterium]|nr:hypothetical protein [Bryobacteraceae bacterium]
MKKKKWPVILGVVFIAVFVAVMVISSSGSGNKKYRAEVCVTFEGRTVCRNAASATKEGAERSGSDTACTDLTSGMTALMQCQQNAPRKVTWKE